MSADRARKEESERCAHNLAHGLANEDLSNVYTNDAIIWHNFTNRAVPSSESVKIVEGFFAGFKAKGYSPPRYVDVNLDYTDKGFVQRHVVEARRGDDVFRMAACIITEVKDGRIWRQYEYLDPKPYLELLERV